MQRRSDSHRGVVGIHWGSQRDGILTPLQRLLSAGDCWRGGHTPTPHAWQHDRAKPKARTTTHRAVRSPASEHSGWRNQSHVVRGGCAQTAPRLGVVPHGHRRQTVSAPVPVPGGRSRWPPPAARLPPGASPGAATRTGIAATCAGKERAGWAVGTHPLSLHRPCVQMRCPAGAALAQQVHGGCTARSTWWTPASGPESGPGTG
jgi:hypothetical protein